MAVLGPPCAHYENYVPDVQPFTDSIWYGVGSTLLAGPREPLYFSAVDDGQPLRFVGTVEFAGDGDGLAVDPFCECVPGIHTEDLNDLLFRMDDFHPRVIVYSCGTNNCIRGDDPADIVASIAEGFDQIADRVRWNNYRIVLPAILKTLDGPTDVIVQAANALIPAMIAELPYADKVIYIPEVYASVDAANMADDFHPNDDGAVQYAAATWEHGLRAAVIASRGAT